MPRKIIVKKKKSNLDFTFKNAVCLLGEHRNYVFFSFSLMLIFAIIGYIFPSFMGDLQAEFLDNFVSRVPTDNPLSTSLFIIQNNLKASFLGMVLGILIVVPFLMLIANGFIIGAVFHRAAGTLGLSVALRLLPHGIFEIPAICIAAGFGIKIAAGIFKGENLSKNYRQAFIVFLFIVLPLILVAGTIEGTLFYLLK